MRLHLLILNFLFLAIPAQTSAEVLSAALGCEILNNTAKAENADRSERFILLFKNTSNTYSQLCLDEIGTSKEYPWKCFKAKVNANSIWSFRDDGQHSTDRLQYRAVLDRKNLILTTAPVAKTPEYGYSNFYKGNASILKPDFSDANPDYRCQEEPDAAIDNFVRNSKNEQLKRNKI